MPREGTERRSPRASRSRGPVSGPAARAGPARAGPTDGQAVQVRERDPAPRRPWSPRTRRAARRRSIVAAVHDADGLHPVAADRLGRAPARRTGPRPARPAPRRSPVSSRTSRVAPATGSSPKSSPPPGSVHSPPPGPFGETRVSRTRPVALAPGVGAEAHALDDAVGAGEDLARGRRERRGGRHGAIVARMPRAVRGPTAGGPRCDNRAVRPRRVTRGRPPPRRSSSSRARRSST